MKHYEPLLTLFNAHLELYRTELSARQPKELYEPENYILALDGKRIRPLLCLLACDLYKASPEKALDAALAIELFHNFTLVHDDILDNAPLRRGKPTVHTKWNTNTGILSGDVMLTKAVDVLNRYDAALLKSLNTIFIKTAIEVCEGQQWDMNFETETSVTVSDYMRMITCKTAVLIGCSLQMGAVCGGAAEADQTHIYGFGKHLGIAFQLLDDMLDVYATDSKKFGKQVGGDIIANKKTFLLLKAFELADSNQKQRLERCLSLTDAASKVKGVMELYDQLNIKTLAQQAADEHTKKAIHYLQLIPADSDKKKQLEGLAHQLLNRTI
ncbi:MAG: polyprenyl synthetase family protein [Bacteroidia bacterium]